ADMEGEVQFSFRVELGNCDSVRVGDVAEEQPVFFLILVNERCCPRGSSLPNQPSACPPVLKIKTKRILFLWNEQVV
ncbi:hypothetical protein RUM43_008115, partial [Polyplax serrata]